MASSIFPSRARWVINAFTSGPEGGDRVPSASFTRVLPLNETRSNQNSLSSPQPQCEITGFKNHPSFLGGRKKTSSLLARAAPSSADCNRCLWPGAGERARPRAERRSDSTGGPRRLLGPTEVFSSSHPRGRRPSFGRSPWRAAESSRCPVCTWPRSGTGWGVSVAVIAGALVQAGAGNLPSSGFGARLEQAGPREEARTRAGPS